MGQRSGAKDGSLLARLREEKEWAMLVLLEHKEPIQCALILRALFESAVKNDDDEAAARIASWVLHNRGEETRLWPLKESGDPMSTEARMEDAVAEARAVEAMELWKLLPEWRVKNVPVRVSEDDFDRRARDFPAMIGTKKALLNEIVSRWRDTKDEEEADRLFAFIHGLWPRFPEEKKYFLDAVREGTGVRFPPDRAARQYLELARASRARGDFGFAAGEGFDKMLAIAFMRNGTDDQRVRAVKVALPVFHSSDAACDALAEMAESLGEFDRKVSSLIAALRPNPYNSQFKPVIRYPEKGGAVLTLEFHPHSFYGYRGTTNLPQFDENQAHDRFAELCKETEAWIGANGRLPLTLVMVVPNEHKPKEPTFRRERTFR